MHALCDEYSVIEGRRVRSSRRQRRERVMRGYRHSIAKPSTRWLILLVVTCTLLIGLLIDGVGELAIPGVGAALIFLIIVRGSERYRGLTHDDPPRTSQRSEE